MQLIKDSRVLLAVIGVLAGLLQLPAGPGAALASGFGGALLAAIGALFINAALALGSKARRSLS